MINSRFTVEARGPLWRLISFTHRAPGLKLRPHIKMVMLLRRQVSHIKIKVFMEEEIWNRDIGLTNLRILNPQMP